MKRRFYIALIAFAIESTTFLILGLTLDPTLVNIFLMAFFIVTFYLVLYFIGGLSKLIIYLIYGLIIFLFSYFFNKYRFAIAVIGTFLLLLNPLNYLENKLAKLLDVPDPIEFQRLVRRSYYPYYDYRAKMKEHYHLPHIKRLFHDKRYNLLISLSTLALTALGIFLSLYELNTMASELANLRLESILVFYVVIIIFVATLILYKKHFRSMWNFVSTTFYIPIGLIAFMTNMPLAWKGSIATISIIATIGVIIYQVHNYYSRVIYYSSNYIDSNQNYEVYANDLYEPYMFNDSFIIVGTYELEIDMDTFERNINKILFYANLKRFFITAYLNTGKSIIIYTQFHRRRRDSAEKFSLVLEKVYQSSVTSTIINDPAHSVYEENFYNTNDYIAARAVTAGKLIKKLEIDTPLVIAMYFYFNDANNLKDFIDLYTVDIISLAENVITIKLEFDIVNVDYLIDFKIREILLNALVNSGKYIRITVASRGKSDEY